jgi:hypothetical protein
MGRLAVLLMVVAAFALSSWASGGNIGASSECQNAGCVVSASSSIFSVGLGFALALLLAIYRQRQTAFDYSRIVAVWRRFGAFLLDLAVVLLVMAPVGAIPILVAEAKYSGSFEWTFARHYSRPTDAVLILPSVFATFLVLFVYLYLHARSHRATIGQFISGYRVTDDPDSGASRYALRVVLSFVGLCAWPVSLVPALRRRDKAFWWDVVTRTKVARVVG